MGRGTSYSLDYLLIALVAAISVLGFWDVYVGPRADPQAHHHLHVVTVAVWLGLLLVQLRLIDTQSHVLHRKFGLAVLFAAPLLVASTAMLSVHSAYRGIISGKGDFLIVQNVMGTVWLALLIVLAFTFRRRRKLHAALLMSTLLLFMGIALFFALIAFAPPFRIEGPETFYRFQTAAMTGQAITLAVGLMLFFRDLRNGWPFLLAPLSFGVNDGIRILLTGRGLIDPFTGLVGGMSQALTFAGTFVLLFALLAYSVLPSARLSAGRPVRTA